MLDQIIALRKDGLSFRKIADELSTTVGKVQYQWVKYQKQLGAEKCVFESKQSPPIHKKKRIGILHNELVSNNQKIDRVDSSFYIMFASENRAYGYWDISKEVMNKVCKTFNVSYEQLSYTIRLFDITSIHFNGHNEHHSMDILIPINCKDWFINGLKENRTYCAELGVLLPNQCFVGIVRSNALHTPRTDNSQEVHSLETLSQFEAGQTQIPNWVEHVSTYSYYVDRLEAKK